MYRLTSDPDVVVYIDDETKETITVPKDHRFWAEYELWLAAGNVPSPEFTDEELAQQVLLLATDKLNVLVRQANAQITALNGRIAALDWLINIQTPEDQEDAGEEYTAPTAADIAELAALKPRYTKWNSYSIKLGKVKTQATWPTAPVWPVMPEPYTNETSAVAPSTV